MKSDARFRKQPKLTFSIFTMSENIQQRSSIKFCVKNDISAAETLRMLQKAFGEQAMSKTQAYQDQKFHVKANQKLKSC